jgi:hypothetical protein
MVSDQLYCEVLLDHRVRRGSYKGLRPGEARRIARLMVESIGSKGDAPIIDGEKGTKK